MLANARRVITADRTRKYEVAIALAMPPIKQLQPCHALVQPQSLHSASGVASADATRHDQGADCRQGQPVDLCTCGTVSGSNNQLSRVVRQPVNFANTRTMERVQEMNARTGSEP